MSDNLNEVIWQVETTHPLIVKPLQEAFREVMDPEIHLDILQLGLVRDVIVEDDSALVIMMLTTPFCPYGPAMLETTRQKAEKALKMPTKIDLSPEPWNPAYMEQDLQDSWGLF